MTFAQFRSEAMRYTREQLRCDVPPTPVLLDLMDRCPKYEAYVERLLKEADANLQRMAFGEMFR